VGSKRAPAATASGEDLVLPDGSKLSAVIRDLVATGARPHRWDEFIAHTGASKQQVTAAFEVIAEEDGVTLTATLARMLLVPDFDDSPDESSPLTNALAAALDDDAVLHPPHATVIPLGHAFVPGKGHAVDWELSPDDECGDCGFLYSDHNPLFGQDPPAPGEVMATGYENGEAVDRPATKPRGTAAEDAAWRSLPNMPDMTAWGTDGGLRVTHGEAKLHGTIRLPDKLAEITYGEEFVGMVRFKVAYPQYRQNAHQEGKVATLHKVITVDLLTLESVSGPYPPSQA